MSHKRMQQGDESARRKVLLVADFPHPGDHYLQLVLCELPGAVPHRYVVWTYNVQDGGFFSGHYRSSEEKGRREFAKQLERVYREWMI